MNNTEKFYKKSLRPSEYFSKYIDYLSIVLKKIEPEEIDKLVKEFENARSKGKTLFIAGNGGSAATATTMANDIGFDIIKKTRTKKAFKLFALTDNNSVMTAISNDVGYDQVFLNQLKIHFKKGDRLIVISASGNSKNLINAVKWVKKNSGRVVGLLGFDGGKLKSLCDLSVVIKTNKGEYGPVEDAHLILNHTLAHWFQNKLK
jgi:D-sedoheptulose 7-phosphate isomerase